MADTETLVAPAANEGPLTIDQAVELQLARRSQPEDEAGQPEEEQAAQSPEGAGEGAATEDTDALTQGAEDAKGEAEEPNPDSEDTAKLEPQEAIEPPKFWDAEGKDAFAKLSKDAQRQVVKYEEQRAKAVDKALRESAIARKTFEARQAEFDATATQIGNFVSDGDRRMSEWKEWFASPEAQMMRRDDPSGFVEQEDRYRAEFQELQAARASHQTLEVKRFKAFKAEQEALLPTLIPEIVGQQGDKVRTELAKYLVEYGEGKAFDPDRLNGLSAYEAQIAWKAKQHDDLMSKYSANGGIEALIRDAERYRKAEAIAKKPPPPQPKAKAGPTAPSAGQGNTPSSDEARFKSLNSKNNLSFDEGVELGLLKRKLGK